MTVNQTPPTSPGDDWIEAERDHERQMAHTARLAAADAHRYRQEVREQWTERIALITISLAVVAIILGITYFVWDGSNKEREANERVIAKCIDSGGTWTYKTCVYLREGGQ